MPRLVNTLFCLLGLLAAAPVSASYLHRQGNKLLDADGKEVRLTGVNWFGFETGNLAPHGLWARDWLGVLMQVKEMGFNCVRIPFCDRILDPGAKSLSVTTYGSDPYRRIANGSINRELDGKTPLEMLDIIISGCRHLGLKVILDNHSRKPDGYMVEMTWTADSVSEEKWIANWVSLAKRYKGNPAVVACDLDNEPHGAISAGGAQWGTGVAGKDWRLAAQKCGNAILAENPDVLIMVEGVEQVGSVSYWWGGNLTGVKAAPIALSKPEKLVYSPHEYGPEVFAQPWFAAADFPGNMPAIWDAHFGYLHKGNQAHLLVGEFGIRDASSAGGKAGLWFDEFLKYMGKEYSWTFWCLNPNSGDTGGLLQYDWTTPEQWKLDKLKPYMAPLIGKPEDMGFNGVIRRAVRIGARPEGPAVDAAGRLRRKGEGKGLGEGPARMPVFVRP